MGSALFPHSQVSVYTPTLSWPFIIPHFPTRIVPLGSQTELQHECMDLVSLCAMHVEMRVVWVMHLRVCLGVCMCEHSLYGLEYPYTYLCL